MPSIRKSILPTARPVIKSAFLKPSTPLRSFSATPAQNATLNQVLKVRISPGLVALLLGRSSR